MATSQLSSGGSPGSLLPATAAFPWPLVPLVLFQLTTYLRRCVELGITYRLGGKADVLTAIAPDYRSIDCSGWVRCAVAVATSGHPNQAPTILPDGSVNQHDWCDGKGLKRSTAAALLLLDGYTRIAFIVPSSLHPVGHVLLCRNGRTMESWGGHGPGSRSILVHISLGILQQAIGAVYILGGKS